MRIMPIVGVFVVSATRATSMLKARMARYASREDGGMKVWRTCDGASYVLGKALVLHKDAEMGRHRTSRDGRSTLWHGQPQPARAALPMRDIVKRGNASADGLVPDMCAGRELRRAWMPA